jgi:hypothetical protein
VPLETLASAGERLDAGWTEEPTPAELRAEIRLFIRSVRVGPAAYRGRQSTVGC